jgi:hypothetical protein
VAGSSGLDERLPRGEAVVVERHVGDADDCQDARPGGEGGAPAVEVVGGLDEHGGRSRLSRDERDLLVRERVVDRHGDGAGEHRAHVGDQVLDPVGGHDRHGAAGLDPEVDEGRGDLACRVVHLLPGVGAPLAAAVGLVAVRRAVAVRRDGGGERVRDRAALDQLLDVGPVGGGVGGGGHGGHRGTAVGGAEALREEAPRTPRPCARPSPAARGCCRPDRRSPLP